MDCYDNEKLLILYTRVYPFATTLCNVKPVRTLTPYFSRTAFNIILHHTHTSSQWLISLRFSSYNSLHVSELIYLKLYGWFPEVASTVTFTWKCPFESWPRHMLSWLRLVLYYFSNSVQLQYITIRLSMTAPCHCSPAFFDLMFLSIVTRLP
jgi:hypothetical protein